jgi:hypothetical protein
VPEIIIRDYFIGEMLTEKSDSSAGYISQNFSTSLWRNPAVCIIIKENKIVLSCAIGGDYDGKEI